MSENDIQDWELEVWSIEKMEDWHKRAKSLDAYTPKFDTLPNNASKTQMLQAIKEDGNLIQTYIDDLERLIIK